MYRLAITALTGVSKGDIFRFNVRRGQALSIGRAANNTLALQDPSVAKFHASIEAREDGLYLVDLDSAQGSWVMGFRVSPGAAGRLLANGDEFKIGEQLFRIDYEREHVEAEEASGGQKDAANLPLAERLRGLLNESEQGIFADKKKVAILGGLLLLLIIVAWPQHSSHLPVQHSLRSLSFPQYRVIGFDRLGAKPTEQDFTHLDAARFELYPSDLLVEYEYVAEVPVEVLIDNLPVVTMPRHRGSLARWQVLVRDPIAGRKHLVFNNTAYNNGKGRLQRWAIAKVRAAPLTRINPVSYQKQLGKLLVAVEAIDTRPEALFTALRVTQKTIVQLLDDMNLDAVGMQIDMNVLFDSGEQNIARVQKLQKGVRKRDFSNDQRAKSKHLSVLSNLAVQFDAELWRRYTSRMRRARTASEVENYIDAYDYLIAIKQIFSEGTDYRWDQADKLLRDSDFIPAKISKNPEKYRKLKEQQHTK